MKISSFAKRFLIMIMCGFLFTGSLAVPVMADEAELTDALGVTPDTDGDINASDQGNIHEDAQKKCQRLCREYRFGNKCLVAAAGGY